MNCRCAEDSNNLVAPYLVNLAELEPALGKKGFQLLSAALSPIVQYHHGKVIHIDGSVDDVLRGSSRHALKPTPTFLVTRIKNCMEGEVPNSFEVTQIKHAKCMGKGRTEQYLPHEHPSGMHLSTFGTAHFVYPAGWNGFGG